MQNAINSTSLCKSQFTPRIIFRNEPSFTYRSQPKLRFAGLSYRYMLIKLIPMLSKGWALHLVTMKPTFRTGLLRILNVLKGRVRKRKNVRQIPLTLPKFGTFFLPTPKVVKTFFLIRRTIYKRLSSIASECFGFPPNKNRILKATRWRSLS